VIFCGGAIHLTDIGILTNGETASRLPFFVSKGAIVMNEDQKRTLTVTEFMREAGTKPTSTWKMIREARLPVIHVGRRILISRETLERFLRGEFNGDDHAA
jgi:hypothetical protein